MQIVLLRNVKDFDGHYAKCANLSQEFVECQIIPEEVFICELCHFFHVEEGRDFDRNANDNVRYVLLYLFELSACAWLLHASPHRCTLLWILKEL